MLESKRVGKTVHLPPEMWELLEKRAGVVLRSRSKEIEYSLKKLWESEDKANAQAIQMAIEGQQRQAQQQLSGEDETL